MFYGDIAGNIRLLNPNITDEQIKQAAEFVQADKFIHTLPNTYHAKVIERGASYSSGQRQLISFARTIVTDPKILVLDEATANIDTETEGLIQEGLAKMRQGRTTIAIAHRLSTIRDANLILVFRQRADCRTRNARNVTGRRWPLCGYVSVTKYGSLT